MTSKVIGQTGRIVLSDDTHHYNLGKKRTVRYQYQRVPNGWLAWVCGPFHSRTYGVNGYGTSRPRAKDALIRTLGNNHGYIGTLMYSDVDTSDTVGIVDPRLSDVGDKAHPITSDQLVGSAGQ